MAEEHHEHHEAHHGKKGLKLSKVLVFQITTAILAIALVVVLVMGKSPLIASGTAISGDKTTVANEVITYLNDNFGTTATLVSAEQNNGVYNLTLDIEGQKTNVYVSPDGKLVFPLAIDTATKQAAATASAAAKQPTTEVPKSTKPVVQLFVMTHCPYGTQIEKGMLPVVETLGDKIDFTVKFVDYSMHGKTEIDEELNQYCIQTQFNSKYLDYLSCFLEDGNTTRCVAKVGIDKTKLASCIASTDTKYNVTNMFNDKSTWQGGQFPQFPIYKTENTKYGVQGSPTLVINEVQASSGRDPASLLSVVCSAFENPPAECEAKLSSTSPSPGFGGGTGTASAASCG